MKASRLLAVQLAAGAVCLAAASAPAAVDTTFTGAISSNWTQSGNWSSGVPTATTNAFIESHAVVLTVADGANPYRTGSQFNINGGSLELSGNARLQSGHVGIAAIAGQSASVTLRDPGASWTTTDDMGVGSSGTGTLTLAHGASLSVGNWGLFIGYHPGSIGVLNIGEVGGSPGGSLAITGPFGMVLFGNQGGAGTLNFNQSDVFHLDSALHGTGNVFQRGTGTTILAAESPDFHGTISIDAGTLAVSSDAALGAEDSVVEFGFPSNGTLRATSTFILQRSVQALTHAAIEVDAGATLTSAGSIGMFSPGGFFYKEGAGTLVLASSNTFLSPISIQAGELSVSAAGQLGPVPGVQLEGGTLRAHGSFTLDREIAVVSGGISTDAGVTLTHTGRVIGNAWSKTGAGTLVLHNASTVAPVTAQQGVLQVEGTIASPTTIAVGGTLTGTGTIDNAVAANGTVAPGAAAAAVLSTGNLSLAGTFNADLFGTAADAHDRLNVTGTVTLSGTLAVNATFTPALGQVFTVLANDGADAIVGTFAGLPQGAEVNLGNALLTISYTGGTGNDVTLTTTAIAPGAPGITSVTPGNGQLTVAFTPAAANGSPITEYTATCGAISAAGASPIVVAGLANGTPYTCTVTATNAVGTATSSASGSVTPFTTPGAPSLVSVTPGNGQVTVAFAAPGSDGGSPITGYSATCGTSTVAGPTSPIVVTGLANGTAYTCTASATNAAGSTASAPSGSVTPTHPNRTVTPSAGANGTISPGTAQSVSHGATATFTVTADTGYAATVDGTCGGTLVGNTYTTNAVTADCTVVASFTLNTYILTVTKLGAGTGLVASTSPHAAIECGATCSASFPHGTVVTLIGSAASGSGFVSWGGACGAPTGQCVVTMDGAKTVTATFDVVNPPRMSNISTRMQVLTGDDVLIGGFVIGGTKVKRVAIVATGPSLAAFGIANALANPTLRLVRSSDQVVLETNDDWQAASNSSELTAAGFAPSNALESAILADLMPGAYTAIVEGAGGLTGVAVIGVYEVLGPDVPLINISTRGRVLTGNDVMIGGFVIAGNGPQTLAIVATGPSLSAFGITAALANPRITLVRSSDQAVLATNDDWQADANAAQLDAAGFAPTNALESGLYVTLPPGAYTVIVEGVEGGTGVAVVGVYKVE
jgi:T5SS/PEP-CTERM-associated repeat protein/autotransporter-associated beta strand protein